MFMKELRSHKKNDVEKPTFSVAYSILKRTEKNCHNMPNYYNIHTAAVFIQIKYCSFINDLCNNQQLHHWLFIQIVIFLHIFYKNIIAVKFRILRLNRNFRPDIDKVNVCL